MSGQEPKLPNRMQDSSRIPGLFTMPQNPTLLPDVGDTSAIASCFISLDTRILRSGDRFQRRRDVRMLAGGQTRVSHSPRRELGHGRWRAAGAYGTARKDKGLSLEKKGSVCEQDSLSLRSYLSCPGPVSAAWRPPSRPSVGPTPRACHQQRRDPRLRCGRALAARRIQSRAPPAGRHQHPRHLHSLRAQGSDSQASPCWY